jgi:hypothetical protein
MAPARAVTRPFRRAEPLRASQALSLNGYIFPSFLVNIANSSSRGDSGVAAWRLSGVARLLLHPTQTSEGISMCMIGTDELNRAVFEDAEMARTFALRGSSDAEIRATRPSVSYGVLPSSFSHADAVSLPGVRMFPMSGASSS